MPFRGKPNKRRYQQPRGNFRNKRTNPSRNAGRRTFRYVHIPSERIYRKELKVNHNVREIYPINLSDLVDQSNIGRDVDVRLVGYNMSVHFATGNKTDTVSCSLSHSGPWVRTGPTDGFNQQFLPRNLKNNKVVFNKRVLPTSERTFLNPHHDYPAPTPPAVAIPPNTIDLEVIDPAGVVPGVNVVINFKAHFIRPHVPVSVFDADTQVLDHYQDQDVNDTSTAPDPNQPKPNPDRKTDQLPSRIIAGDMGYYTTKQIDPNTVEYTFAIFGSSTTYRITTQKPLSLVGQYEFKSEVESEVKANLIKAGFHPDTVTVTKTEFFHQLL